MLAGFSPGMGNSLVRQEAGYANLCALTHKIGPVCSHMLKANAVSINRCRGS